MTTFDRIEPRLPELIDELATASVPDYFDDLLRATAGAKQRPAWSSLERWLPMGVIARPRPFAPVPWRLIAIAAALVLLAAAMLTYVGSRPRVPAPFGPAANGQMFFDADGVVYAADPSTGVSTPVVSGDLSFRYPLPSRDGQRIVYDNTQSGVTRLFVSDADGSNAHPLAGDYRSWTWTEWSPDGREVGIVASDDLRPALHILVADGSATRVLPLDREVLTFWWLPDGGFVFTGAELPGDVCRPGSAANRCALFVVGADGLDPRMLVSAADFNGLSTSVSSDGTSVLFVRWTDTEPGRLYLVGIASGALRPVPFDNLAPEENSNWATFSPDGTRILFDRYETAGEHWAVIPTAGGAAVNLGPEWPDSPEGTGPEAQWSPDGRTITAFYPGLEPAQNQLWMLDVTGQGSDQRVEVPATYLPAWQRRALAP